MGKVILVTGASKGMGRASAEQLISDGHTVYGLARDLKRLKSIRGLKALEGDMANDRSLVAAVETIMAAEGKIDVLFNNAGIGVYGAIEDVPVADGRQEFEVNLFGMVRLTQLVLPHMRQAGEGLIINTSSMGGKVYFPLGAWYYASKYAVEGFSDSLRVEVKRFGIKVVLVEPGAIATHSGDGVKVPLMEYSGNGAYGPMVKSMVKGLDGMYSKPSRLSPPSVVAKLVSRIVTMRNPKPRYAVGKLAKPLIFMRTRLGDRLFDRIAMLQTR